VFFPGVFEMFCIWVAQRGDPHVAEPTKVLEQLVAAPAQADEPHIELLARALSAKRSDGKRRAESSRLLQEIATMDACHSICTPYENRQVKR
jgi:hypothetical protein